MQERLIQQVLAPSVQHGEESDFSAEVDRVGGMMEDGLVIPVHEGPRNAVYDAIVRRGLAFSGNGHVALHTSE